MSTTSTTQKTGLVLAGLLSASNIPSVLLSAPEGEVGPPMGVLVIDTLLGILGLVAVIVAWRTARPGAFRVAAGSLTLIMLTALPAFFVDVPAGIKVWAGISVLATVLSLILLLSRPSQVPHDLNGAAGLA